MFWCPLYKVLSWEESRAFKTAGVEKNQTSSPRVNPGKLRVAIKGTPTFLAKIKSTRNPLHGGLLVCVYMDTSHSFWLNNKEELWGRLATDVRNSTPLRQNPNYPDQANKDTFQRREWDDEVPRLTSEGLRTLTRGPQYNHFGASIWITNQFSKEMHGVSSHVCPSGNNLPLSPV